MTTAQKPHPISAPPTHGSTPTADQVLRQVGWGVLLVLTGIAWILPSDKHPIAFWLIGVGALLLVLNAIRTRLHIPVDGLGVVAGLIALTAGIGTALNTNIPIIPLGLLALGALLIVQVFRTLRNRQPS